MHLRYAVSLAILGLALPSFGTCADYSLRIGGAALQTDNIAQDNSARDAAVYELRTALDYRLVKPSLNVDLESDLTFRKFSLSEVDSEFLPDARGAVAWEILPERLVLVLEDTLGQAARASSSGLLPPDRERVNVISGGPVLSLDVGGDVRLALKALASNADYSESGSDSDRTRLEAQAARALSGGGVLYLDAYHAEVDFSLPSISDYSTDGLFAGFQFDGRRTFLSANLGIGKIKSDDASDSALNGDVTLRRRLGRRSELELTFQRRFGDAADAFVSAQGFRDSLRDTQLLGLDGFASAVTTLGSRFSFSGSRVSSTVSISMDDQDSVSGSAGRFRSHSVEADVSYALRPMLRVGLDAEGTDYKYSQTGESFDDRSIAAYATWTYTTNLLLSLRVERLTQDTALNSAKENRAEIRFEYRALERQGDRRNLPAWSIRRRQSNSTQPTPQSSR